jgi:hypothetical protein
MMDMHLGDTQLILSECRQRGLSDAQTAYILATAKWETAHTMRPVVEAYWKSEEWRSANLRYYPWHGRGYVQLTWQRNYLKAGQEIGVDLTSNPELALRPDVAVQILVAGCMGGWFTGRKLTDYISGDKVNFIGARRVVNGTDRAEEISEIARHYLDALGSAQEAPKPDWAPEAPAYPDPAETAPAGFWAALVAILARLFGGK